MAIINPPITTEPSSFITKTSKRPAKINDSKSVLHNDLESIIAYTCNKSNTKKSLKEKSHKKESIYQYEKEYVEHNLIAYIGSKRRLLDLIIAAVKEIEVRGSTLINRNGLFIDYFAGTGVVSRMMKSLGFNVIANDWEYYSYSLNRGFLECSSADLSIFDDEGGIELVLAELNGLIFEHTENSYIAKYYCPENDKRPNPHSERMFYTRQNGVLLDNIRTAISERYDNSLIGQKKHDLLLALLLIQGSKRSNTSGVFKGFHYGFGGRKQDALSRILAPVALEIPVLSKVNNHSIASCSDALVLSKQLKHTQAEVVYLDPPYNQHQYGSNYHLLNTIAKNDRPPVNKEFLFQGKKVNKSAIRKDWVHTKSKFCYCSVATEDFTTLIKNINSKYILVSYSSEGIISLENMINILASKGKVAIITRSYVRYRGGRQANTTQNRNLEFVLIVDTGLTSTKADIKNVQSVFLSGSLQNIFTEFFPLQYIYNTATHLNNATSRILKNIQLIEDKVQENKKGKGKKTAQEFTLRLPSLKSDFLVEHKSKNRGKKNDIVLHLNSRLYLDEDSIMAIRALSFKEQKKVIEIFSDWLIRPNHIKANEIYTLLTDSRFAKWNIDRVFFLKEFMRFYKKVNFTKNPEYKEILNKQKEILLDSLNIAENFSGKVKS